MKNAVMFTTLVLVTISPCVFASIENIPDIGTFNWNTGDDFSDLSYSLNNWDLQIPSAITFGINADDEYGYLQAGYTSSNVYGNVIPTQSNDIIGIRADLRLASASVLSDSVSYYAVGIDIAPQVSLYWGISVLRSEIKGILLLDQSSGVSVLDANADFPVTLGDTYNLAIVLNEPTGEYYLYLNGEKKTSFYFPEETSLSCGYARMYSRKLTSRFEFDNIEFATIPEPATLLLLGLGGLIFRKHKFNGEK